MYLKTNPFKLYCGRCSRNLDVEPLFSKIELEEDGYVIKTFGRCPDCGEYLGDMYKYSYSETKTLSAEEVQYEIQKKILNDSIEPISLSLRKPAFYKENCALCGSQFCGGVFCETEEILEGCPKYLKLVKENERIHEIWEQKK